MPPKAPDRRSRRAWWPGGGPNLGLMAGSGAGVESEVLRRLVGAVVGLGADLDIEVVLRRIIETATVLVDARYGALGVLDEVGTHLDRFLTVGIDDERRREIGDLPEGHGILGLLIVDPRPIRLPDLSAHPESFGFPPGHPPMTSFLGVPIFIRGAVYGNLYLTDKNGGGKFTATDEELAIGLAAAAAVAIENVRLHARVREMDQVTDRERIARDLHDTVIQRLFATGLSLQGTSRLIDRPEARDRVEAAIDELDLTVREIRTAIFELQPSGATEESLRRRLLAVCRSSADALGAEPACRFEGPVDVVLDADLSAQVEAVVREGLANVARHALGSTTTVTVTAVPSSVAEGAPTGTTGSVEVVVADTGPGPGELRPGGHGLANLLARASERGGRSTLEPGPAGGSVLRWSVPVRRPTSS